MHAKYQAMFPASYHFCVSTIIASRDDDDDDARDLRQEDDDARKEMIPSISAMDRPPDGP